MLLSTFTPLQSCSVLQRCLYLQNILFRNKGTCLFGKGPTPSTSALPPPRLCFQPSVCLFVFCHWLVCQQVYRRWVSAQNRPHLILVVIQIKGFFSFLTFLTWRERVFIHFFINFVFRWLVSMSEYNLMQILYLVIFNYG